MSSSRIRRTVTLRASAGCFWTPGLVQTHSVHTFTCVTHTLSLPLRLHRTRADQSEGHPDARWRQSAGTVLLLSLDSDRPKRSSGVIRVRLFVSQYGVPVTKYDRRGFKPRPRQLLLTNTFAALVDQTKIKQRVDYTTLRGTQRT